MKQKSNGHQMLNPIMETEENDNPYLKTEENFVAIIIEEVVTFINHLSETLMLFYKGVPGLDE